MHRPGPEAELGKRIDQSSGRTRSVLASRAAEFGFVVGHGECGFRNPGSAFKTFVPGA
jgi:hypothetical protein